MTDPDLMVSMTPKAEKALKDDTQFEPMERLLMEMVATVPQIRADCLFDLADQLVAMFDGDIDRAIVAIKTQEVKLAPVES